jgi:hypothetical protein
MCANFVALRSLQIGGCAHLDEKYLAVDKMTAQAATAAKNIASMVAGTPATLVAHVEAGTKHANAAAPVVNIGRNTFAAFVPETMDAFPAFCLRACGPPLNCIFFCPCVAFFSTCGGCTSCSGCCGCCCGGYPQGGATAEFVRKLYASGMFPKSALGWAGTGANDPMKQSPTTVAMSRS